MQFTNSATRNFGGAKFDFQGLESPGPFKGFLLLAGNGFIFKDTVEVVAVEDPEGKFFAPCLRTQESSADVH